MRDRLTLSVRISKTSKPPHSAIVPTATSVALTRLHLLHPTNPRQSRTQTPKSDTNILAIVQDLAPANERKDPENLRLDLKRDIHFLEVGT